MTHKLATLRPAVVAAILAAATGASLSFAAVAHATTYNVTDTTSFVNAVNSSSGSSGNDTINMAGGIYLPTATLNFSKTTGTVTVVGTTARPQVKIDGSAVNPKLQAPIVNIAKTATVTFQGVLFTTGGGPGVPGLDVFGTLDLENAQVSGNNGAGVVLEPNSPAATIRNSTLDSGLDFGLINQSKATLINDTVYLNSNGGIDNTVGQTTLINTIVAKNGGTSPTDCFNHPAVSSDHSLDSDGSCVAAGSNGNLSTTDPKLGKLVDDGGPTASFPVQPGSPVIDAGNSVSCPANDVRFFPRPDDISTACDIGSDEYNATPPTINTPSDMTVPPDQGSSSATVNYTVSATSTDDKVVGANPNTGATGVTCDHPSGSSFPMGTTKVTCTAKDYHGATGTGTFNVTVSSAAPPAVTLTSPADGSTTNNASPTFSGAAGTASGDSSTVTVKVYSGSSASGTPVQTLMATASSGSWSVAASSPLTDGVYTAQAQQSNSGGPTGTSAAHTFTVDTVAPAVTLTDPANASTTGNASPTFSGAAGTASGDSSTVTVKVYSGSSASGTPVQTLMATASAGAWSVAASSPLADGTYTAQALQSDAAGNIGHSSANTFTISTSLPAVTLTAPANGSATNNATPTFSGAAGTKSGDSSTVTVKVYSGSSASGTPVQTLMATASAGNWSVAASSALTDGTYTARAQQSNSGAGTGFSSANTFTVDTVAPVVTLTNPANGSSTGSASPTFSGAAGTASGDSSTVTVKVYSGSSASGTPVQTLMATASAGAWSVAASSPLANGTYTAQAFQSDAAGNTGHSSANTFTVAPSVAPVVTLTNPANGSRIKDAKPTFSGAAGTNSGDSSTVTVKVYSGTGTGGSVAQTLMATQSAGAWSVAPASALADGTYTAQAQQSNGGATGSSSANTFTVDTTAPIVTTPGDMTVAATGPGGAPVTYSVSANDPDAGDPATAPACMPASGTTFKVGKTPVTCTSQDSAGNTGTATFNVTVEDQAGPVITLPPDVRVMATSPYGAFVNYPAPSANDEVDGSVPVNCTPASGSAFKVGSNTVTCFASDAAGNPQQQPNQFHIYVDNTPPRLTVPNNMTVPATGPSGAIVTYPVGVSDPEQGNGDSVTWSCDHPSGSLFPIGTTTVTCNAQDAAGNPASAQFAVTVNAGALSTGASKLTTLFRDKVIPVAHVTDLQKSGHVISVNIACVGPKTDVCVTTLQLSTQAPSGVQGSSARAKLHRIVLSTKTFKLTGGAAGTVHIKVGKIGDRLLAHRRKLDVLLEIIQAQDGWSRTTHTQHVVFRGRVRG